MVVLGFLLSTKSRLWLGQNLEVIFGYLLWLPVLSLLSRMSNRIAIDRWWGNLAYGVFLVHAPIQAVMQERFSVVEVVLHQIASVPFGSRAAGPLMEDSLHRLGKVALVPDMDQKRVFIPVVHDGQIHQVTVFGSLSKVVCDQDILATPFVERLDRVAADEAGTPRHDDHGVSTPSSGC